MKRLACFAFGIVGLVGCAPKPGNEYTVYVDPGFTYAETDDIVEVMHAWEKVVPVKFTVILRAAGHMDTCSDQSCYVIRPATGAEVTSLIGGGHSGVTWRNEWCDCGFIALDTSYTDPLFLKSRDAHELGHAMGLIHTGGDTLMNPSYAAGQQSHKIMCADQAQWYNLRDMKEGFCLGDQSL